MANSEFRVCCSPWAATDGGSNSWTASGTNILTAPSREDPEEGRTGQSDAFALTFQPSTPNTRELDAQPRLTMPPTARSLQRRSGRATRLLVTRLDRLARSTRDLLNTLDALTKAGAKFKSLADAWADTTTPHGRLIINTLSGLGRPPVGGRHDEAAHKTVHSCSDHHRTSRPVQSALRLLSRSRPARA